MSLCHCSAQAHQMSLSIFPHYTCSSAEVQFPQCKASVLVSSFPTRYMSFPFSSEVESIVHAAPPPATPKPVVLDAGYLKALVHVVPYLFALAKDIFDKELERNETKIVYVR